MTGATFNQEANIICSSSRVVTDSSFLYPPQIMIDLTTKICDTLQRGDPEEISHLQFHMTNLFPCDILTLTFEQMTSNILDILQRRDPDEVLHLFVHVSNLMSCKRLNPVQRHFQFCDICLLRDSFFQKWDARRDTRSGPTFPLVTLGPGRFSRIKKSFHFFNTRDVTDSSLNI